MQKQRVNPAPVPALLIRRLAVDAERQILAGLPLADWGALLVVSKQARELVLHVLRTSRQLRFGTYPARRLGLAIAQLLRHCRKLQTLTVVGGATELFGEHELAFLVGKNAETLRDVQTPHWPRSPLSMGALVRCRCLRRFAWPDVDEKAFASRSHQMALLAELCAQAQSIEHLDLSNCTSSRAVITALKAGALLVL